MHVRIACALLLLIASGCRGEPKPTASTTPGADAEASPVASVVPGPSSPSAASGTPAPSTPPDTTAQDGGRAAPVGGNWLKCYANFQPRTRPEIDVMRLGLMCGPSNGLRKVTAAEADIAEGAKREHRWRASIGDCYRIFAVSAPEIADLDVEVFDAKGARLAFDTSDDRWPVVNADGAFCVFEDGDYKAEVHAQKGAGKYAIEIWRLR